MTKRPKIDANIVESGDYECLIFEDIPLEWFSDGRGHAALELAEARARARRKGKKVEN